jgi:hypothetical protein
MKRLFIVTAPIDFGRNELEEALWIEDIDTEKITEIMDGNPDFQLWDLVDFVEFCNNQEFDVEGCWMQSVEVEVPDDYSPNKSTWYMKLIRF